MSRDRTPDVNSESLASQLSPEIEPPAGLEQRVVAGLRAAGALRPGRRRWAMRDLVAAAAMFVVGLTVGVYGWRGGSSGTESGSRFLLLLYPDGLSQPRGPGGDAVAREYAAWAAGLRRSGRTVTGDRLAHEQRAGVGGADGSSLDSTLEGFFIVGADSLQEAVRFAEDSPHVRHGGRIVVRAIDTQ